MSISDQRGKTKKYPELTAKDVNSFLRLIKNPSDYDLLKEMRQTFNIRQVSEFNLERVSHAAPTEEFASIKQF